VGIPTWWVSGTNGENRIEASAATQSEAWLQAVEQARTLGMLRRQSTWAGQPGKTLALERNGPHTPRLSPFPLSADTQ
jgi:hypothetical protein